MVMYIHTYRAACQARDLPKQTVDFPSPVIVVNVESTWLGSNANPTPINQEETTNASTSTAKVEKGEITQQSLPAQENVTAAGLLVQPKVEEKQRVEPTSTASAL